MKKQKKFIAILIVLVIVLISANGFIFSKNKSLSREFDNAASKLNANSLDPKLNLATYSIAAGSTYIAPTLKIKTYPLEDTGKTIDIPESWDYTESTHGIRISSPSMDFIDDPAFSQYIGIDEIVNNKLKLAIFFSENPLISPEGYVGNKTDQKLSIASIFIDDLDLYFNIIKKQYASEPFIIVSKNNFSNVDVIENSEDDFGVVLISEAGHQAVILAPVNENTLQRYSEYQNLINIIKSIK